MTSACLRRITITAVLMILLISVLCMLAGCAPADNDSSASPEPAVSVQQAKKAALKDAGVKAESAVITRRKLVQEQDGPVYKICFTVDSKEDATIYEYDIDAVTGKVIASEKQIQTKTFANIDYAAGNPDDSEKNSENFIGVRNAMLAVIIDSGLDESEVQFTSVRLVNRAGHMVYDTEFRSADVDYEFDVDAFTGRVITRDVRYAD